MTNRLGATHDPLGALPPSRHPFQVFALLGCIAVGFLVLLDPGYLSAEDFPEAIVFAWALTLIIASATGLMSAWWVDRITGLMLERIGLTSLSTALLGFSLAALTGLGGVPQEGAVSLCLALACGWRAVHARREKSTLIRVGGTQR